LILQGISIHFILRKWSCQKHLCNPRINFTNSKPHSV